MALSALQLRVCRLLAEQRRKAGVSYVAGGVALGEALRSARISRDVDLFHDDEEALRSSWHADRTTLVGSGLPPRVVRELPGFVEAVLSDGSETVVVQWARDSAFRFLPLVEHEELGLTLHPLDLATNKVLAAVGRLEVRDWVDLIESCEKLQPLGCLAWAACAKDPGFSPSSILEQCARTGRYSQAEVDTLAFWGERPDAADLGRRFRGMLDAAREIVAALPTAEVGTLVLDARGEPFRGDPTQARTAMGLGALRFHRGCLRGAWPTVRPR
jgi:hypothetical protein